MGKNQGGRLHFPIGGTFFGSGTPTATGGEELVGKIFYVDDDYMVPGRGIKAIRGNRDKCVMVVRNSSGITLLPKRLAQLDMSGGVNNYYGHVTGYATTLNQWALPIDEYLPPAGVRPNDLFYVVISGTAKILLPEAGASFGGSISIGDALVAATGAATSAQSTAGRIGKQALANATDAAGAFASARNVLATALSAATTGQTGQELLVSMEQQRIHV